MGKRYIKDLVLNIASEDVENAIQEYLRGLDFKLVYEEGEQYYKTGGVMLTLRGFKYSYQDGILHLEAWVGKIGKEMNIGDGKLIGAAAKVPYYNSVLSLMAALESAKPVSQQQYSQFQSDMQRQDSSYAQQFQGQKQATASVMNEVNKANDRNAIIAFWLSIASLILMFGSRFSLLLNLFSYTLAIKYGLKSQKSGLAITAIVINSIVIVITLLLLFLS